VDHEIVLPCLAAIGRLLPTAGDLGLAGTDLGVEPLRELGVSRHIRQVRSLKLIR